MEKSLYWYIGCLHILANTYTTVLTTKQVARKVCFLLDYFKIQSHDRVTRNNNYLLQIPKAKLKYAKNGLFSMRVTLYNELPTKTRKIQNFNDFRKDVFNLYMQIK